MGIANNQFNWGRKFSSLLFIFFRKQSSIQQTNFYAGLGSGYELDVEGEGLMVILLCGDGRI